MIEDMLKSFDFYGNSIRITDVDGTLWFVAKDVCKTLDIKNHRHAIAKFDEREKARILVEDSNGILRPTSVISEAGLYLLLRSSKKPKAVEFDKWVRTVLLPHARKTGFCKNKPIQPEYECPFSIPNRERNRIKYEKIHGEGTYFDDIGESEEELREAGVLDEQ